MRIVKELRLSSKMRQRTSVRKAMKTSKENWTGSMLLTRFDLVCWASLIDLSGKKAVICPKTVTFLFKRVFAFSRLEGINRASSLLHSELVLPAAVY